MSDAHAARARASGLRAVAPGSNEPALNEPSARATSLAWLAHPASLAGIAVLLLNDHVLKAAFGTWWTGKLSDVAGLVFAPALVALVAALFAPRARAATLARGAIVGVGLVFAFVKATALGAAAASAAWTAVSEPALGTASVVRHDATDLLALPALALAWWVFTQPREGREPGRLARTLRAVIVLPIAVLAVAATSAGEPATRTHVGESGGLAFVGAGSDLGDAEEYDSYSQYWASSPDGRAFVWSEDPPSRIDPRLDCVAFDPDVCYRVAPEDVAVEASSDAGLTWREVSHREGIDDRVGAPADWPDAYGLIVVESGDEYRVFVATDQTAFAVRAVDGSWYRVNLWDYGVPGVLSTPRPASLDGYQLLPIVGFGLALGLLTLLAVAIAARGRDGELSAGVVGARIATVIGALAAALLLLGCLPETSLSWNPSEDGLSLWMASFFVVPLMIVAGLCLLLSVPLAIPLEPQQRPRIYGWAALVGLAAGIARAIQLPEGSSIGWRLLLVGLAVTLVAAAAALVTSHGLDAPTPAEDVE